MGLLRTAALAGLWGVGGGVAGLGAGMAYLLAATSLVPLTKEDRMFRSGAWRRHNPHENPALKDDVIKVVPLARIRPELRADEAALTLEFCRGVWGRWGFHAQSILQERYDHPAGTDDNLWRTSELAASRFAKGLRFSNHFEVVENAGDEIVVRCGGSPLEPGLRASDGLIFLSARIDPEQQHAVFHFKSALFSSKPSSSSETGSGSGSSPAPHPIPPKIVFLHGWYVRMLTQSAMRNVQV
ncbi:putative fad linked oxidase protein [Rosellinia necatrix]|uniref:Putative fad linked oxidase protein n=1 Tax=Rosellinia necatrix TaxID=77044 RepID=A0A1W2TJS0_ROSNE|nr:putative fad linked oxidase protein [Rosellinia necatrix]